MSKALYEVAAKALITYGENEQLLRLQEEAAALVVAVGEFRRTGKAGNLIKQVATLRLFIAQVKLLFGAGTIDHAELAKLDVTRMQLAHVLKHATDMVDRSTLTAGVINARAAEEIGREREVAEDYRLDNS